MKKKCEEGFQGVRVLVTGITGFIGSHLSMALQQVGAQVYGVAHAASPFPACGSVPIVFADLSQPGEAERVMAEVRPDVVYHLAGLVHTRREMGCVLEQVRHNFVGSLQVLIAAASSGCKRIVLAGTAETGPAERVNGVPNSPYAASKQAACDFCPNVSSAIWFTHCYRASFRQFWSASVNG